MIIRLILLIIAGATAGALSSTPSAPMRNLSPLPEPDIHSAVIHRVYLPLVLLEDNKPVIGAGATIYGYATPHRRVYRSAPFYNWGAYPQFCANSNYWPMVRGQRIAGTIVEACDDGLRLLLVYNEPELGHFSATPAQAAIFLRDWANRWSGPLACCGNFYADGGGSLSGLAWFKNFIAEYAVRNGAPPPLAFIHLHVYEFRQVDTELLKAWRNVADEYGWGVIVSESGTFPTDDYPPVDVAKRLPDFLVTVENELEPDYLFWFSDFLQPWALGRETAWHHFNLTNIDNSLTPVGEAWQRYTGEIIEHQP